MTSKFLVPLQLAEFSKAQAHGIESGVVKVYLRAGGLRVVRQDGVERDLVLDRTLEDYRKASSYTQITSRDTVKQAIEKLDAKLGSGSGSNLLERDVTVAGTTVGNLNDGTTLEQGMSMTEILEEMLRKRNSAGYTPPTASWVATPYKPFYEVGERVLSIDVQIIFHQNDAGPRLASDISLGGVSVSNNLSYTLPGYIATTTPAKFTGYVNYAAGPAKPDNFGVIDPNDPNRIQAGRVDPGTLQWVGVYPWFYGTCADAGGPTAQGVYAGIKNVEPVGSVLEVPGFGTGIQFLWFAVPAGTPLFRHWFRTVLNQANIGSPQDLFNAPQRVLVPSQGNYQNWTQDYDVYITNYATGSELPMRLSPNNF